MTQTQSTQIDDLLMAWFYWNNADRAMLGHSRVAPSCRNAERTDVYADGDDVDARINTYKGEQVDVHINTLGVQHRSAIGIHTANTAAGNQIYRNPRMTREEVQAKYLEAKELLLPMFKRADLLNS